MFIRPALLPEGMEGAGDGARYKIRDPFTYVHLLNEGEHKPETEYWLRRIADGGVEIVTPSAAEDTEGDESPLALPAPEAQEIAS